MKKEEQKLKLLKEQIEKEQIQFKFDSKALHEKMLWDVLFEFVKENKIEYLDMCDLIHDCSWSWILDYNINCNDIKSAIYRIKNDLSKINNTFDNCEEAKEEIKKLISQKF